MDTGIEYEAITVETDEGVSVITLNRPDRRNAYIPRMGFESTMPSPSSTRSMTCGR